MFLCSQSHHLQGAHFSVLAKVTVVKIVSYGTPVCDDVAAYIGSVLDGVCMSHCSTVD
jgi:hypothetical protein